MNKEEEEQKEEKGEGERKMMNNQERYKSGYSKVLFQ